MHKLNSKLENHDEEGGSGIQRSMSIHKAALVGSNTQQRLRGMTKKNSAASRETVEHMGGRHENGLELGSKPGSHDGNRGKGLKVACKGSKLPAVRENRMKIMTEEVMGNMMMGSNLKASLENR
eukprot:1160617-Pelagomonas_calceolata.AAC.2